MTTIETEFYNWQRHTPAPDPAYRSLSPNLDALGDELSKRWAMEYLGGYGWRPIRGGSSPSSHGFGAAIDLGYRTVGRTVALSEILPFLLDLSEELGVQAVHDYYGSRIWRAGRGWKAQTPSSTTGMGQSWATYFHIETSRDRWADSTPIPNRLGSTPIPAPVPIPNPGGPFMHATIKLGDVNADVFAAQVILRHRAGQAIVCDGVFGQQTDKAVRNVQAFTGNTVDGIVGPKTWGVLDFLANG